MFDIAWRGCRKTRGDQEDENWNIQECWGGNVYMRRTGDIFEQESYKGTGGRNMSGVSLAMIICSVISVLAAIFIIVNFKVITVRIAIFMANLLSSGALILVVVIVVIYLIVQLKRKMRRRFWRW